MTVCELSKLSRSPLKCLSGFNGKLLCIEFKADKHKEIGEREVLSVWSDIRVSEHGYGHWALPHLCCYVDGRKECEEALAKQRKKGGAE